MEIVAFCYYFLVSLVAFLHHFLQALKFEMLVNKFVFGKFKWNSLQSQNVRFPLVTFVSFLLHITRFFHFFLPTICGYKRNETFWMHALQMKCYVIILRFSVEILTRFRFWLLCIRVNGSVCVWRICLLLYSPNTLTHNFFAYSGKHWRTNKCF